MEMMNIEIANALVDPSIEDELYEDELLKLYHQVSQPVQQTCELCIDYCGD